MKRLLHLYPRSWRERYGREFSAMLEEQSRSAGDALDIVRGALDAQLRYRVHSNQAVHQREMQLAVQRNELRTELHAAFAARDELGPDHQELLVEHLLDRVESLQRADVSERPSRSRVRAGALLIAALAAIAGLSIGVHHQGTAAHPLVAINPIDAPAPVPSWFAGTPVNYDNKTFSWISAGKENNPYSFQFWYRYSNCAVTPRGAFRITVYTSDFKIASHSTLPVGPLTQYSSTRVESDRSGGGEYEIPVLHPGFYYWKVEIPSRKGCAYQFNYNGS